MQHSTLKRQKLDNQNRKLNMLREITSGIVGLAIAMAPGLFIKTVDVTVQELTLFNISLVAVSSFIWGWLAGKFSYWNFDPKNY